MVRRNLLWFCIFAFVVLLVLVLALIPTVPHAPSLGWDKANHTLAFLVLAWLGCKASPQRTITVLLGLLVYGVLIEILQTYTLYRTGDWHDLLADALGLLLFWLWLRLKRFKDC
jgi:VanZ family protein